MHLFNAHFPLHIKKLEHFLKKFSLLQESFNS